MEARLTEREEALTLQAPPAPAPAALDGAAAGAPGIAESPPPMSPPDEQQQLGVEPVAGNGVPRAGERAGGLDDGGFVADAGTPRHADEAIGDAAAPAARAGAAGGGEAPAGSGAGDLAARAGDPDSKAPRDRNGYFVFRFPGGRP